MLRDSGNTEEWSQKIVKINKPSDYQQKKIMGLGGMQIGAERSLEAEGRSRREGDNL